MNISVAVLLIAIGGLDPHENVPLLKPKSVFLVLVLLEKSINSFVSLLMS